MSYVRGKGSRETRTRLRTATNDARAVFRRTKTDEGVCTAFRFRKPSLARSLLLLLLLLILLFSLLPLPSLPLPVTAFGRAALHLSNQRPRGVGILSIREIAPAAAISFRLHSHSRRVRST